VDIDMERLKKASEKGLKVMYGDVRWLPFYRDQIDVVFTNALFTNVEPEYVEKGIKNIIKVARKYIILVEFLSKDITGQVDGHKRTAANWIELFNFS